MKYLKCYFNLYTICLFYTKVVLISAELLSKLHHLSGLLRKGWGYGSFKTKGINLIPLSFISTGLPISQDLNPLPPPKQLIWVFLFVAPLLTLDSVVTIIWIQLSPSIFFSNILNISFFCYFLVSSYWNWLYSYHFCKRSRPK